MMVARILTDRALVSFDRVDLVKQAVGEPVLAGDDRLWILGQPFEVELTRGVTNTLTVPRGFVTDGASVPYLAQVLTGWKPWDEPQRWGALVHDYAYCMNGSDAAAGRRCGKPYADQAFRAVLRAAGAGWLRAETMYRAVDLFGGHAYATDQLTGPTVRP